MTKERDARRREIMADEDHDRSGRGWLVLLLAIGISIMLVCIIFAFGSGVHDKSLKDLQETSTTYP